MRSALFIAVVASIGLADCAWAHAGKPAEAYLVDPAVACRVYDSAVRLTWRDTDQIGPFGEAWVEVLSSTASFPPPFFGARPTAAAQVLHRAPESDLANAFTWRTSTVASGHYLVWSWVIEAETEPLPLSLTHLAPNWITVAHPGDTLVGPTIVVTEPANQLANASNATYEIRYTVCGPDTARGEVRLEVAYRGREYELLADGLPAVADGRFSWPVRGLLPGPYFIRASVRDGCGRAFVSYARYPVDVRQPLDLDAGARDVPTSAPLETSLDPDAACGTPWPVPDAGVAEAIDAQPVPDARPTMDAGARPDALAEALPDEGCACAATTGGGSLGWLVLGLLVPALSRVVTRIRAVYRRGVRRGLIQALFALLAIAPGMHQAIDAVAHAVVVDETTENPALHHEEHEDGERGCSGVFHVCACHAPSVIGIARRQVEVHEERPAVSQAAPRESFANVGAGYPSSIFRPPIA